MLDVTQNSMHNEPRRVKEDNSCEKGTKSLSGPEY